MKKTYKTWEELKILLEKDLKKSEYEKKENNNPGFQNVLLIGEYGVGKTYTLEKALEKSKKSKKVFWINASYFNDIESLEQQIFKNMTFFNRFKYWIINGWKLETICKIVAAFIAIFLIIPLAIPKIDEKIKYILGVIEGLTIIFLLCFSATRTNIISLRKIIRKYEYVIVDDLNRLSSKKQLEAKEKIYNFFLCLTEDMNNKEKNITKIKKQNKLETKIIFVDSYFSEESENHFWDFERESKFFDIVIEKLLDTRNIIDVLKENNTNLDKSVWDILSPIPDSEKLISWMADKSNFRLVKEFQKETEAIFFELANFINLLDRQEQGFFLSLLWLKIKSEKDFFLFLSNVADIKETRDNQLALDLVQNINKKTTLKLKCKP